MGLNSFRVYSFAKHATSWSIVGRGLVQGLRRCGKEAHLFPIDDVGHDVEGSIRREGFDADVAVCVGPPGFAGLMRAHGEHRLRLMMIAPNSSWLPEDVFESHERLDAVDWYLSPSLWGAKIIRQYTDRPVAWWPHGFDPDCFHPDVEGPAVMRRDERRSFEVLHLASTHLQRKSTKELIWAWVDAWQRGSIPVGARLRLVCDGPPGYFRSTIEEAFHASLTPCATAPEDLFALSGRMGLRPEMMAVAYREHDFVCQPSRAEGFGMVPLEARACGVPAIMTTCTGHQDHAFWAPDTVVPVASGPEEPIDDGPDAEAPSVTVEAISEALGRAYEKHCELTDLRKRTAAEHLRFWWTWEAVTRAFLSSCEDRLRGRYWVPNLNL
jgi:glycosyltransferase involved in cell wall biosynthesis